MISRKDRVVFTPTPKSLVRGFTLIELLVVITIMMIALAIAIPVINNMSGNTIKSSAQIVKAVFMKTAQYASTQGVMYFISFDKEKSSMSIYEDGNDDPDAGSDPDNKFDKSQDKQVGETVALLKGVIFSDKTPLFKEDQVYVGFKSNGSLVLPEGVSDLSLGDNPAEEADIILEQKGKPGKMYLDFTITTGRIIRTVYNKED